jgi:hypothetical protein
MLRSRRGRTHAFLGKIVGMRVSAAIRGSSRRPCSPRWPRRGCPGGTARRRHTGHTMGCGTERSAGTARPGRRRGVRRRRLAAHCGAAVLDSRTGDLILTATHRLAGGLDATFVAGYSVDAADDDVWQVNAVYLDQRWVQDQDPRADFAIARVSRDAGDSFRSHAGRGLVLAWSPDCPVRRGSSERRSPGSSAGSTVRLRRKCLALTAVRRFGRPADGPRRGGWFVR